MPEGQDQVKLVVKDLVDRGGVGFTYRVVVKPVETAFQLALNDEQVAIPRGGVALIPVTVARAGYDGPIALDVLGVPAGGGVTVLAGTVPAGQTGGVVGLKADAESPFDACEVQVVGKGADGQAVAASRTIVFAQQTITAPGFGISGTIPSYARPFVSLASAVTRPGPILLNPRRRSSWCRRGARSRSRSRSCGRAEERETYKLVALSPPTGLNVAESEVGETGTSAKVKVTAAADAPLGPLMVGLVAQAPTQGGGAPPARATVPRTEGRHARPAPAGRRRRHDRRRGGPPSEPGTVREGDCPRRREPPPSSGARSPASRPSPQEVVVKLEGLPAGVKAEPVRVAADVAEFTLTLRAADDTAPAQARANAVVAFKLGGKDYSGAPGPLALKVLDKE